MSGSSLEAAETVLISVLFAGLVLGFVSWRLGQARPDFNIRLPLGVGFGLRLLAIAGISSTGLEGALRGGDETTFLTFARFLASQPFGHGYLPHSIYQLHTVIFAIQIKVANFSVGALRITQVGIAMLGVLLIVAAVHDLAGGRAARIAAWALALEPASIFFNSALHKEPVMELASGLVVFGGTKIWRRLDPLGVFLCAFGGLIAVETRSYAGWFLVSASVLLLLHAALRQLDRPLVAMPMIYAVAIAAFITVPVIVQASSKQNLKPLQASQTANSSGAGQGNGPNGSNLALEKVDYSTRGKILANLPKRMTDVVVRPYPWQLGDASQRFGAIGTLIAWAGLLLLVRFAWQNRGRIMSVGAPLIYPMFFLWVAYALSAGNAGTGFRYRTHLVTLGLALVVILRQHAIAAVAPTRAEAIIEDRELTPATGASPRLAPATFDRAQRA